MQLLNACLEAGAASDPREAAERLRRSVCEPLDQGLVVLDAGGGLLSINLALVACSFPVDASRSATGSQSPGVR